MSCCFRAAPAAKDPGRSNWKRGKERHCLLLTVSNQILYGVGNVVWRVWEKKRGEQQSCRMVPQLVFPRWIGQWMC